MPDNQSINPKTFSIPGNIDLASGYLQPNGDLFVIVEGWVAESLFNGFIILDSNRNRPVLITPHFFYRKDVEDALGPCIDATREGYGFIGLAKNVPVSSSNYIMAIQGEKIYEIGSINIPIKNEIASFLTDLENFGLQNKTFDKLTQLIMPALGDAKKAWHEKRMACVHNAGCFGNKNESPILSVVVHLEKNAPYLETQMLAFAESGVFKRDCELIYVLGKDYDPAILESLENLSGNLCMPIRWFEYLGEASLSEMYNAAIPETGSEVVILMDNAVIPFSPNWHLGLAKNCSGISGAAALDILGQPVNGLYRLTYSHYHKNLIHISIPDSLTSAKEFETIYPDGRLLAIQKKEFIETGGFDAAYFDFDIAVADLCRNFALMEKRIDYAPLPSVNWIGTREKRNDTRLARMLACGDTLRFIKKWN